MSESIEKKKIGIPIAIIASVIMLMAPADNNNRSLCSKSPLY